jgi:hypothetical protein
VAGDWIKVEKATLRKPEVATVARLLGVPRHQCLGILLDFWMWLDDVCVDGHVDACVDADVDAVMSTPGLASALKVVGWASFEYTDDGLSGRLLIPNHNRHFGESAKNRSLKSERQARWRAKQATKHVDATPSTTPSTREEKRREYKNNNNAPEGFARFWSTWPQHKRKAGKPQCLAHWQTKSLEANSARIVAHVEAMRRSVDWTKDGGAFIPAPLVYLRQERYDAPAEVAPVIARKVAL